MTDWSPYPLPPGGLPALQCVATWGGRNYFGQVQPLVFWAGTDGTLWQSSNELQGGFDQLSSNAAVTRMAANYSNPGPNALFGIDSSGKPVSCGDNGWTPFPLGDGSERYVAVDVAVAAVDESVWYVMREGQYYVWSLGAATLEGSLSLPLKAVAPMKSPDPSVPTSVGQAWGVIGWGGLAYSSGDAWVFNNGDNDMISDLVDVSTTVSYAWLLKTDGSVWVTQSGYDGERVGASFTAKSICGGVDDYCYAVATDGTPWRTTDPNPM